MAFNVGRMTDGLNDEATNVLRAQSKDGLPEQCFAEESTSVLDTSGVIVVAAADDIAVVAPPIDDGGAADNVRCASAVCMRNRG